MLSNISTEKDNLIAVRLSGTLTKADIETLHTRIHDIVDKGQKVDWYVEVEADIDYNAKGIFESIKMDALHLSDYGKIAVVGDKKWQEWVTKASNFLTSSEVKFYQPDQKETALNWVTGASAR